MARLAFPPPVDFVELLLDLRRAGMSGRQVCKASGLTRGAIGEYRRGRCRPAFGKGEALIELWCSRTGRTRNEVPRLVGDALSASKVARQERGTTDCFTSPGSIQASRELAAITRAWGSRSPTA